MEFRPFPNLPAELRIKIWQLALPQRTVYFRLRMDMDAWNWASELDWWAHYLLTGDYQSTPMPRPALALVNHEARIETLRLYRRLQVDREMLKFFLKYKESDGDHEVDEAPLIRMCNGYKTPWFNVNTDILEWAHVKRWSRNDLAKCGALFLATSMSVQHVIVEYDSQLQEPISALALAVLDVNSALKSLTFKATDAVTNQKHEFRLARLPTVQIIWEGRDNGEAVLDECKACFFPGWKQVKTQTEALDPVAMKRVSLGSFALISMDRLLLDTYFAIYRVLASPKDVMVPAHRLLTCSHSSTDGLPDNWEFNNGLQNDVALFLHRLSIHNLGTTGWSPGIDTVPVHGACLPGYGLP